LASHILDYQTRSIEITKNYGKKQFHEFIQEIMKEAGIGGKNITFKFTDTQIIEEGFLEDINNILNSGEIPNLWQLEQREEVISETRPINEQMKRLGTFLFYYLFIYFIIILIFIFAFNSTQLIYVSII